MVKNHKRSKSPKKKTDGWMAPVYDWNRNQGPYWNPGYDRRIAFRPSQLIIPPPEIINGPYPIVPDFQSPRIIGRSPVRIVTDVPTFETSELCSIL